MKAAYSLVTVILILVAGFVGYYIAKNNLSPTTKISQSKLTEAPKAQTIFTTQTATIQGSINKVDGSKITVTNTKNENGQFSLSPRIVIYKFKAGSTQASASSDIKTIETGKQALMSLELANGDYQVVSVSYLPNSK